jgi:hypothetical protein
VFGAVTVWAVSLEHPQLQHVLAAVLLLDP